jgi:hypothetical protein
MQIVLTFIFITACGFVAFGLLYGWTEERMFDLYAIFIFAGILLFILRMGSPAVSAIGVSVSTGQTCPCEDR